jgi:hypothetical protein
MTAKLTARFLDPFKIKISSAYLTSWILVTAQTENGSDLLERKIWEH